MLDLIEFDQASVDAAIQSWCRRDEPHPGVRSWVASAVSKIRASAIPDPVEGLVPVSRWWARQRRAPEGTGVYEEVVHGRRYESIDGGVRELRLIRSGPIPDRLTRDGEREIAFAAGVVSGASLVLSRPWSATEYRLGRFHPPAQVRIVEIGGADGVARLRFVGSRKDAIDRYAAEFTVPLTEVAAGGEHRPGAGCARCALVAACPAVPSLPGLLGSEAGAHRRDWSVSYGRVHQICPARAHFTRMFIPADRSVEETAATRRGRAVHDWLERNHLRQPSRPCTASDAPSSHDGWQSGGWAAEGMHAKLGAQMLGDHSLVCPVHRASTDSPMLTEHPLVVFDPAADTVVIAKADLLYRSHIGWTLRETKTQRRPSHGDLFAEFPQVALATVLSASGVLAGEHSPLRVELERLTGSGPILTEIAVDDQAVLARARAVVDDLIGTSITDTKHRPRPGPACRDCPFARWCPAGGGGA